MVQVDDIQSFAKEKGTNLPNADDLMNEAPSRKYTLEEYEALHGKVEYDAERALPPKEILEYDYECFDGNCERKDGLNFLVLGGTQFLGRLFVESVLDGKNKVTILNRGVTPNPFGDKVKHIKVDRLFDPDEFGKVLDDMKSFYDVVVDFTGVHGIHLVEIIKKNIGKMGYYIYMSSASVYMFADADPGSEGKWAEMPLTSPETASEDALRLQARYGKELVVGEGKLSAENFLLSIFEKHKFPLTILRLPDVVGEFDNRGRHLGVQSSIIRGIPLGNSLGDKKFSLVYSQDVIKAINKCIKEKPQGQILNIAGDEVFTLEEYASMIATELDIEDVEYDKKKQSLLPSTKVGPLDNYKAKSILGWMPTPATEWLPKVVEWNKNPQNMQYTASILQQQMQDSEEKKKVKNSK